MKNNAQNKTPSRKPRRFRWSSISNEWTLWHRGLTVVDVRGHFRSDGTPVFYFCRIQYGAKASKLYPSLGEAKRAAQENYMGTEDYASIERRLKEDVR